LVKPLVIMSASPEPQHAEAAIAAGANFFMTKPFNLTILKDVITQPRQEAPPLSIAHEKRVCAKSVLSRCISPGKKC
jgi:CheY-like chemotaxis protein